MIKPDRRTYLTSVLVASVLFMSLPVRFSLAEEVDAASENAVQERSNHRIFFGSKKDASVSAATIRLTNVLKQRIDSVDRSCELTETQKRKLELAGRGSIHKLFEDIEEQKRTLLLLVPALRGEAG